MKNKDKNTITQFKMYYNLDKELEYINEMNRQGWKLVYIKCGCFYSFVKTQPDEYFTTMYMDDKERISQVATFAAQCGYESVPHTIDGIGNLLYLTAPKDKVSEEFVCDRESKIKFNSKLSIFYLIFSIIFFILTAVFAIEVTACLNLIEIASGTVFLFMTPLGIMGLICAGSAILLLSLFIKLRKKIKQLKSESFIYE